MAVDQGNPTVIPVGDEIRPRSARALLLSAGCATWFTVFAFASTQLPSVRAHSAWQSDPYDLVVTFTIFAVPALLLLGVVRVQLCRRDEPLPAFRLRGMLRLAQLALLLIACTATTDWVGVLDAAPSLLNDSIATGLLVALTGVTVSAAVVATMLARLSAGRTGDDDWLAEVGPIADLIEKRAPAAGRQLAAVLRVADRHLVNGPGGIRAHPFRCAAVTAVAAGLLVSGGLALREGQSPGLFALEALVFASGAYALMALANHSLRLAPLPAPRSRRRRAVRVGLVTGCAATALALGCRDLVWSRLGFGTSVDSLGALYAIVGAGFALGLVAGTTVSAARSASSGRRTR